ncbi:MAG: GNAT family N-acetyltransferase [Pseudomonadota bacterium]
MTAKQNFDTARLRLRGLLPSDRSFIADLISDENARRYLGGPVPMAQREAYISRYFSGDIEKGQMVWLVEAKETHLPLGMIFVSKHKDGGDFELSYQFRPAAWGFGYAAEAAKRILDYALNDMQLTRLIAETQSINVASCRLLERLGMKELRRVQRFGAEQIIYAS